jgi:hypothetical protein
MKKWILMLSLGIVGCSSFPHRTNLSKFTSIDCEQTYKKIKMDDRVVVLNGVSSLFDSACYLETIALGQVARDEFRDKQYSVFAETTELLTPEGTMTEYVMESYERAYLSFLISASYRQIHKLEDSQIELRRSYQETQAWLYNYGEDPVNLILQAVLWENSFSPQDARCAFVRVHALCMSQPTPKVST